MCLLLLGVSVPAQAQSSPELRPHHVTINAGVLWFGGYDIGTTTAELRGNASGPTAPPFTLFTAASRLTTTIAPELRVGVALTPRISLEGGASFSSPNVGVAITADAEAPCAQPGLSVFGGVARPLAMIGERTACASYYSHGLGLFALAGPTHDRGFT